MGHRVEPVGRRTSLAHVLTSGAAVERVRATLDDGTGGVIAQCEWGLDVPQANVEAVFEVWSQVRRCDTRSAATDCAHEHTERGNTSVKTEGNDAKYRTDNHHQRSTENSF